MLQQKGKWVLILQEQKSQRVMSIQGHTETLTDNKKGPWKHKDETKETLLSWVTTKD